MDNNEDYAKFWDQLKRSNVPEYVHSTYKINAKIYININEGCREDANSYFKSYFANFFDKSLIEIVEQKGFSFLAKFAGIFKRDSLPYSSPPPLSGHIPLKSGHSLIAIPVKQGFKVEENLSDALKQASSIEELQERLVENVPLGTLGCFMEDGKNGGIYALTAQHAIHPEVSGDGFKLFPATGDGSEGEILPVVCQSSGESEKKLHQIGNKYFGSQLDFALVKLDDDDGAKFSPINRHPFKLNVFSEENKSMYGEKVQKYGAATGCTIGTILPIQIDLCIRVSDTVIEKCTDVFLVQSNTPELKFCDMGDSGSLVASLIGNVKGGFGFGLCIRKADSYIHYFEDQAITYENVTLCLRLDHCLQFAENKWNISLDFIKPTLGFESGEFGVGKSQGTGFSFGVSQGKGELVPISGKSQATGFNFCESQVKGGFFFGGLQGTGALGLGGGFSLTAKTSLELKGEQICKNLNGSLNELLNAFNKIRGAENQSESNDDELERCVFHMRKSIHDVEEVVKEQNQRIQLGKKHKESFLPSDSDEPLDMATIVPLAAAHENEQISQSNHKGHHNPESEISMSETGTEIPECQISKIELGKSQNKQLESKKEKRTTDSDGKKYDMEEKYESFCEELTRLNETNPPGDYLQSTYKNQKRQKIYVNVDDQFLTNAEKYFKYNFGELWKTDLLEVVGQSPIEYQSKENSGLQMALKDRAELKHFIERGSRIMALPLSEYFTASELERIKQGGEVSLEGVMARYHIWVPSGTSAGFVQDSEGDIYLLTARHVLKADIVKREVQPAQVEDEAGEDIANTIARGDTSGGSSDSDETVPCKDFLVNELLQMKPVIEQIKKNQKIYNCHKNKNAESNHSRTLEKRKLKFKEDFETNGLFSILERKRRKLDTEMDDKKTSTLKCEHHENRGGSKYITLHMQQEDFEGAEAIVIENEASETEKKIEIMVIQCPEKVEPGTEPSEGSKGEILPILTEVLEPQLEAEQAIKVHHIGSEYFGSQGMYNQSGRMKEMDFAMVKVTDEIKNHDNVRLCNRNKNGEKVTMEVYRGLCEEMHDKEVQKDGITTGLTKGKILPFLVEPWVKVSTANAMKIRCFDSFCIQSLQVDEDEWFSKPGDSGGLITSMLDDETQGLAYGMVLKGQEEYKHHFDDETKVYKNVSIGGRLDHCFEFARIEWQKEGLKFIGIDFAGNME